MTYYLFREHEDGEWGSQRFSFIFPERCFSRGEPGDFGSFLKEKTGLEVTEIE